MNEPIITCTCCGAAVHRDDVVYVDARPCARIVPMKKPLFATTVVFAIGTAKMQATNVMTYVNPAVRNTL